MADSKQAGTAQAGEAHGPEFIGVALQVSVKGVNRCNDRASARARINENIQRIGEYTTTAANFLRFFYGLPVRLVALPEYTLTGFPMRESVQDWRDRACLEQNGPEYEALGKLAQANNLYLSGNVYEIDPHFPELYFQTCFIIGPSGDVILRYRRLTSCFEPTPHDVWDKYLDIYGEEGVFPVAKTEIGNLGTIASEEILYPEITRCVVLRGAEVILHPTSEPGSAELTIKEVCRRARAIENQVLSLPIRRPSMTRRFRPIPAARCRRSWISMAMCWPRRRRAVRPSIRMPSSTSAHCDAPGVAPQCRTSCRVSPSTSTRALTPRRATTRGISCFRTARSWSRRVAMLSGAGRRQISSAW